MKSFLKFTLCFLAIGLMAGTSSLLAEGETGPGTEGPRLNQYVATDDTSGYIDVGSSRPAKRSRNDSDEEQDPATQEELEALKEYVEEIQRSTKAGRDGQAAVEAVRTANQVKQAQAAARSYKF